MSDECTVCVALKCAAGDVGHLFALGLGAGIMVADRTAPDVLEVTLGALVQDLCAEHRATLLQVFAGHPTITISEIPISPVPASARPS